MTIRNLRIVFAKELVDITRDRRTLIFMILVPILVMPGLFGLIGKLTSSGVERLREQTSVVAIVGGERAPSMVRLLRGLDAAAGNPTFLIELADPTLAGGLMHMLTPEETADVMEIVAADREALSEDDLGDARFLDVVDFEAQTAVGKNVYVRGPPSFLADAARLRLLGSARILRERGALDEEPQARKLEDLRLLADRRRLAAMSDEERAVVDADLAALDVFGQELTAALEAERYHAVVIFHEGFQEALAADGTARYSVLYDDSIDKSGVARSKVSGFLDKLSTGIVRSRVVGLDLDASVLRPLARAEINVGRERSVLAVLLPYIVILMCLLGAIFPAIDLGAGEKERGTLETLLVTPARRIELVLGKFLVITASALVAAMLNIASLTLSVKLGMLEGIGATGITFEPMAVAVSVLAMLPVSALFAAALLAISIFAKSFKEANSYAGPMQIAVIVPALVSFIPGIELTLPLALVPLVSVSLALKEAWSGIFQWDAIAVLLISSAVYAAAMLAFCVRWFQREEVLFRT